MGKNAVPKPDPEKFAAEVEDLQQEIRNLEKALGKLVDAFIAQEKPGPEELRKLKILKKQATGKKVVKDKTDASSGKKVKPRTLTRP